MTVVGEGQESSVDQDVRVIVTVSVVPLEIRAVAAANKEAAANPEQTRILKVRIPLGLERKFVDQKGSDPQGAWQRHDLCRPQHTNNHEEISLPGT